MKAHESLFYWSQWALPIHDTAHDAFMTLPPYTRSSEGEVHEPGPGVRNCFHSTRSDPLSETRESIERAYEATSAKGTARCASRGLSLYPERVNPGALWSSARAVKG